MARNINSSGVVGSNAGSSGGGGAPTGNAGGSLAGTYPNPTIAASAITTTEIADGTIVTGDLSATAGITSGQLAGSIAPSKITGTAVTAADTGTVTSTMLLDGTILNADVNASAAIAATKVVQPLPPDQFSANVSLYTRGNATYGGQFVGITVNKPVFIPIAIPGLSSMTLSNLRVRVSTLNSAQTMGMAIYSATYASSAHVSASLVAQLNAAQSMAATGVFDCVLTTGAAGSGAGTLAMDFTTTRYLLGMMASDVTTAKCAGFALPAADAGLGVISWTGTARSGTTDWPASFTEAASIAAVTVLTPFPAVDLLTATGAFFL